MSLEIVKFSLICMLVATPSVLRAESPTTVPRITTVVEHHFGGVGGVVSDQMGYVYISDFLEQIWRLNPLGNQLELYASGFYGASGSAFDKNGNLYQANFFGNSISRVSRTGVVSTFVSDNLIGPVGMVFDADQNLIVCNCGDQSLKKISPDGSVTTFAKSDLFSCPNGVVKNSDGDFIVVSFSSSKIVRVSLDGETSVFADTQGNGVGHIVLVRGIYYATSYYDNTVYRIDGDGRVSVFAGTGERKVVDGLVSEAAFSNPNGIAIDASGTHLYINDNVGDASTIGLAGKYFSVRTIELPRLNRIVAYEIDNHSLESAEQAYWAYQQNPANVGELTESEINTLGWSYLLSNEYEKAILVFRLNSESNPDSWNAFSSLGAAYLRAEENELAKTALQRSVELNSENTRAITRLKQLEDNQ